jgi:SnoaL-like domain
MTAPAKETDLTNRIAHLEDRAAIQECMLRYTRGMDRRDRALLRSAYHDGAIDNHVGYVGEVEGFIDWAFAYHSTQTRYQHYLHNHTVEIDGDIAHAETYYLFIGTDRKPANHMTLSGGRYVDRLERREGRWAIVERVCVVEWMNETTATTTSEFFAMLSPVQTATHDREDPSYLRPLMVSGR